MPSKKSLLSNEWRYWWQLESTFHTDWLLSEKKINVKAEGTGIKTLELDTLLAKSSKFYAQTRNRARMLGILQGKELTMLFQGYSEKNNTIYLFVFKFPGPDGSIKQVSTESKMKKNYCIIQLLKWWVNENLLPEGSEEAISETEKCMKKNHWGDKEGIGRKR